MNNNRRVSTMTSRRRRRQKRKRQLRLGIALLVAAVALIVLIIVLINKGEDRHAMTTQESGSVAEATATPEAVQLTPEPTTAPTPEPTPYYSRNAHLRPDAVHEAWLPVFQKADTQEKMIAITVDDCFQAENLRQIVDKAIEVGGKLTIFPIGKNVIRNPHAQYLKYAWEHGMELENHTYTHNGLYNCSDETLAQEIFMQNLALSYILGVEYKAHFLRPLGGDARFDQRMHSYCKQMGYAGIAHWSKSGSGSSISKLKSGIEPGDIYLFHTTDADLEKLLEFIPYAVEQGYQLVTMNEMFGYPENETGAPFTKKEDYPVMPLEKYDVVYITYKKNDYQYGVKLIQDRLIELGLLNSDADGRYGDDTANAIKRFQEKNGLQVTGKADPETQEKLFDGNDPRKA